MTNDEGIQEIHNELKKREEYKQNSVFKKLSRNTKLIFLAIVGAILLAIYFGKIETKTGLIILGVVAIIIYFSTLGESGNYGVLTEQECRVRLHEQLRIKQLYPFGGKYQINPRIKITHMPDSKLKFLEGKPWKWLLGLKLYDPENFKTEYYAAVCNPYNGDLQGMDPLPGGMGDMDKKDIQLIPDYKMFSEKKYHDYMGKYWKE